MSLSEPSPPQPAAAGESRAAPVRAWAIVPAAGRSLRMGRPKLLLPWGAHTVIEAVLAAWRASRVAATIVVVHPDDLELAALCRRAGAEVVQAPQAPPDMKASVILGLDFIERTLAPRGDEAWLAAPADLPLLSAATIDRLIAEHDPARPRILVPVHGGRRGHPVLFPWALAAEARRLGEGAGLDRLLADFAPRELASGPEALAADLDTPDDYRRLHDRYDHPEP